MQKFGLQRHSSSLNSAIEREIVKEQATALGRAGKKLRLSLESYEKLRDVDRTDAQEQGLIKEISNNLWELLLQREVLGFIENNVNWVRENYHIPDAAIESLGNIS